MDQADFETFVQNVVTAFEQERQVRVTEKAINALIKPALPHLKKVSKALDKGKLSPEFLTSCLRVVLENAVVVTLETRGVEVLAYAGQEEVIPEATEIDEESIRKSISRYCPYLFWC